MRFLILNTDYPEFLAGLYAAHPGLETRSYEEQTHVRHETLFGVADFYSTHLRSLGHEAWDIYVNNERAQRAWAAEHGIALDAPRWRQGLGLHRLPWFSRASNWFATALSAQIDHYKPDVVVNLAVDNIDAQLLKNAKHHARLLVGQHAAPLPKDHDLRCYDLLLSSLPNLVDRFRQLGVRADHMKLAFEPRVLERLKPAPRQIAVSFVGSLTRDHQSRRVLLEQVCTHPDVQVWGPGANTLPADARAKRRHKGTAWALDMYHILHSSKITVNHHIDMAEDYANNMRLFEATGVGALLLTDAKKNLGDMFEPWREVVAYRNAGECTELISHYLEHEAERDAIARAGQQRTLRDHTYFQRMQELVNVVGRYV